MKTKIFNGISLSIKNSKKPTRTASKSLPKQIPQAATENTALVDNETASNKRTLAAALEAVDSVNGCSAKDIMLPKRKARKLEPRPALSGRTTPL